MIETGHSLNHPGLKKASGERIGSLSQNPLNWIITVDSEASDDSVVGGLDGCPQWMRV